MSKIAIQKNISSGGKFKDALTRGEIFLEILNRHPTTHDDVIIRSQSEFPLIARIIGGHLDICIHRDITVFIRGSSHVTSARHVSTTTGRDRHISSAIQRRLNLACQPAIN